MKTRSRRALVLLVAAGASLLALAACSPVAILNGLAAGDTHQRTTGLAYGPLDRHRLDVYTPASAPPSAGFPVVVFFYGGSWTSGERRDYAFVGEALASRGMLTLIADYRLHPEVGYPDFLVDSARALAFGLERAASLGGDPKRVFVMGHSAGGYNAAMLAIDPRWLGTNGHDPAELAGWIGLAGAYDFFPLEPGSPARPVFHHPDYPERAQPIPLVHADAPPAYLAAAERDRVVSVQRSTLSMASALRAAGVPVELRLYEGLSHSLLIGVFARPLRGLAPALDDVAGFVSRTPPSATMPLPHRRQRPQWTPPPRTPTSAPPSTQLPAPSTPR